MAICIVQPTAKTQYLRLGLYDADTGLWKYKQTLIPVEFEDTRFRDAVRLLSYGWVLFDVKGNPYRVNEALRADIENDPPKGIPTTKIDFSGFWRRYEKAESFRRDPITATLDQKSAELVARYRSGETLPSFIVKAIQKYL